MGTSPLPGLSDWLFRDNPVTPLSQAQFEASPRELKKNIIEAFQIAVEQGKKSKEPSTTETQTIPAIAVDNVRLYSYADPLQEKDPVWNHINIVNIFARLQHSIRKDRLHLSQGRIACPGIEVRLTSKDEAHKLKEELSRVGLTPNSYPQLSRSRVWRWIILTFVSILSIYRHLFRKEEVFAYYCSEDRTYLGSIYHNPHGVFFSVHGKECKDVKRGALRLESLLSS